jgi:hypothetical protein
MTETAAARHVCVATQDDALIRVLVEHRSVKAGWIITSLPSSQMVEPEALLVIDLAGEAASTILTTVRGGGFDGRALVLGGAGMNADAETEILPRPVRLGRLLDRIDAHWAMSGDSGAILLGPYAFHPTDRMLRHRGTAEIVRLTELEGRLLSQLAEAEGMTLTREQLLTRVWGYSGDADTHTVETHVWRLRQKIETDDPDTAFLLSESGGYRLDLANATMSG